MSRLTLEKLLQQDPMSKIWERADQANKEAYALYGEEFESEPLQIASKAIDAAFNDPEKRKVIARHRNWTREGIVPIAELCGADSDNLHRYIELSTFIHTAGHKVLGPTLKRSWSALAPRSNVIVLEPGQFPTSTDRPFIVFFSANWCFPCLGTKPIFARLSRFFDKARLFYTSDDEIARREGIKYYPTLAAYLPNGSVVTSQCGGTTEELWKTMNLLVTLGQSFQGRGQLVCDENECKIVNPE